MIKAVRSSSGPTPSPTPPDFLQCLVVSVRTRFFETQDSAIYNVQHSWELLHILWGDSPQGWRGWEGARGRQRTKIPADTIQVTGASPSA